MHRMHNSQPATCAQTLATSSKSEISTYHLPACVSTTWPSPLKPWEGKATKRTWGAFSIHPAKLRKLIFRRSLALGIWQRSTSVRPYHQPNRTDKTRDAGGRGVGHEVDDRGRRRKCARGKRIAAAQRVVMVKLSPEIITLSCRQHRTHTWPPRPMYPRHEAPPGHSFPITTSLGTHCTPSSSTWWDTPLSPQRGKKTKQAANTNSV